MVGTGTFSPVDSTPLLSPNRTTLFSLTGPVSTFATTNALFLSPQQQTHLCFTRSNRSLLLSASALKSRRKGGSGIMEMDGYDFDDDDEDDDAEGMFLPFGEMKRWLDNKPRGFGEGKLYDTSVEDKLLEEIEQSRKAQIANINKLKNNPVNAGIEEDVGKQKAFEVLPSGIRVRLVNLPKKKNIHRDLKSAFEGVPGIINISPAVSGNKKTKDPICKGFAFVDFKSEEDATRFVQIFSRQSISFGKIQKQIKCEMMNSSSSKSVDGHFANSSYNDRGEIIHALEADSETDSNVNDDSFDSWMQAASNVSDPDDESALASEDTGENPEFFSASELHSSDITLGNQKSATDSSSNRPKKLKTIGKKLIAKGKLKKIPKLEVPGSAKRLKVKEKAVLKDVFSKYAVKDALASKTDS